MSTPTPSTVLLKHHLKALKLPTNLGRFVSVFGTVVLPVGGDREQPVSSKTPNR